MFATLSFRTLFIGPLNTFKSNKHHLEVLNVAALPKVFKSFETTHVIVKPMKIDNGGLPKPVKYPYIANINA